MTLTKFLLKWANTRSALLNWQDLGGMRSTVKYASMNLTVFFVKWELCPSITAKGFVCIVCLNFDTTSWRNVLKSS